MARVDFYLLPDAGEQSRRLFACRLTEKAWKLDNRVYLLAPDRDAAAALDELLWTFRDGSFVPHEVDGGSTAAPVTIGCDAGAKQGDCDLLINLCDELPAGFDAFPRVAEIVTSDEDVKRLGRARYARYRDAGHELEMHKL